MWFKVDDHLHDHAKVWDLDLAAIGLWTLAGSWCGENGTDGFVPESVLRRWPRWRRLAGLLVERKLWHPVIRGGVPGFEFVNWFEYQPTRDEALLPAERLRWRRRQALKKDRALCEAIVTRDGSLCRYCAVRVNWRDRKGPAGGTYDHVDPDGENTLENVVVACRRCNGRKRDRTPEEAGMTLLDAPESGTEPDRIQIQSSAHARDARETVRAGSDRQPDLGRSQVGSGPGPGPFDDEGAAA